MTTSHPTDSAVTLPRSDALPGAATAAPGASPPLPHLRGGGEAQDTLPPGLTKLARAMSEDELLSRITLGTRREPGICKQLGLGWVHHRRSEMANPGWPDLVIKAPAGRVGVLFWELKSQTGKVTPEQQEWLDALEATGCRVGVRRPSDLLSGRVARELAALAGIGT